MFVASLLTSPDTPVLDPSLVESLRNAWGGGEVKWLMPDVAAEFPLSTRPDNVETVWQDLQGMQVDVVVHVLEGRKKQLLLADMDSTMIQQECIDELAARAGIGEKVADITARAMNGEIAFEGALRERVRLLKGLRQSVIDTVLDEQISYMPGGKTLLSTMKAHGAYAALVSGGFTSFTGPVAAHLGFDEHRSNQFEVNDEKLTGQVIPPIFGKEAKVEALEDLTAKRRLSDDQVLAVGDGANDLGMLTRAGMGVALHAKPAVQAQADFKVNHGDLTALLFLQGYSAEEFVT
ncbi:MAG: phosphoserine phosphatase SerB [Litoreibacter sp.]|nr:phosphoserine phosphatase SerB [Litoreibacter sp.]